MQPSEQTTKEFSRWGKPLPTSQGHGTTDDIRQSLTKLKPNSWRMEGNKLIGMTSFRFGRHLNLFYRPRLGIHQRTVDSLWQ